MRCNSKAPRREAHRLRVLVESYTQKKHSSNCSFNLYQGNIAQGLTINLDVRLPDWHDNRG